MVYLWLIYLVGGWATPLKNIWKSVGIIIPNIWKNKKCFKPPTSYIFLDKANYNSLFQEQI